MKCDKEQLTIVKIDQSSRGVEGCGQRATYVEHCPTSSDCTWVLNTDSRDSGDKAP